MTLARDAALAIAAAFREMRRKARRKARDLIWRYRKPRPPSEIASLCEQLADVERRRQTQRIHHLRQKIKTVRKTCLFAEQRKGLTQ